MSEKLGGHKCRNHRDAIDKLVDILLERETLTGDEFMVILSKFVDISVNNPKTSFLELIGA